MLRRRAIEGEQGAVRLRGPPIEPPATTSDGDARVDGQSPEADAPAILRGEKRPCESRAHATCVSCRSNFAASARVRRYGGRAR